VTELTIDGRTLTVAPGTTLLAASRSLGIEIPTLCHLEGYPHHTSCMVCLVEDLDSGALLPACATPAGGGQRVRTGGRRVEAARRRSLELLLSEHVGDCEAPCTRACPAHPDLPGMIRQIGRGDTSGALAVLLERLPLAGTLAEICPAPCERACRRGKVDAPVAIRVLKREAMRAGSGAGAPARPDAPPERAAPGVKGSVAVVGAGPAGLSAAYFLARRGHHCVVFDDHARPGGALRQLAAEGRLPNDVLRADLALLASHGVEWQTGVDVEPEMLATLRSTYDAVVLAPGSPERLGRLAPRAVFARSTTAGSTAGLFACGNATRSRPSSLAVQAVADGRRAALAAAAFLAGTPVAPERLPFDSRLAPESAEAVVRQTRRALGSDDPASAPGSAPQPAAGDDAEPALAGGLPASEEALRCLDCDCAAKRSCKLRELSGRYAAEARHFAAEAPRTPDRTTAGGDPASTEPAAGRVSFEPGKCIKCGICVRIVEEAGERPGLAFGDRGYEVVVRVPFGEDLGTALGASAREAVRRCPTGALVWETRLAQPPRPLDQIPIQKGNPS
jgi:ferredoxin